MNWWPGEKTSDPYKESSRQSCVLEPSTPIPLLVIRAKTSLRNVCSVAQIPVHWVSDPIQPSRPLPPCSPPAFNLSQHQGLFQWVGSSNQVRWAKYWSFNFSISPYNEYSGLISFRTDWFDLLAVQGTLKSLLQHHSLKASILWHSAFFMDQKSSLLIAKTLSMYLSPCHAPVFAVTSVTAVNLPKPKSSVGFWTDSPCRLCFVGLHVCYRLHLQSALGSSRAGVARVTWPHQFPQSGWTCSFLLSNRHPWLCGRCHWAHMGTLGYAVMASEGYLV